MNSRRSEYFFIQSFNKRCSLVNPTSAFDPSFMVPSVARGPSRPHEEADGGRRTCDGDICATANGGMDSKRCGSDNDVCEMVMKGGMNAKENELINKEYTVWKQYANYLYDTVITHVLHWPSLTCQWFPNKETPPGKNYTIHRLLLGTHTSGQDQEYLQIATVFVPKRDNVRHSDIFNHEIYSADREESGGHTIPPSPQIQVTQKITHPGEVNRARCMPQNPEMLVTKAATGEVFVFDRTEHASGPEPDGVSKRDIRLVGQVRDGYGLAWNPNKAGHIIGAPEDVTVCYWDCQAYSKKNSTIQPTTTFESRAHTSVVGDVDWHPKKEYLFASVGNDMMLMLWDTRSPGGPVTKVQAHNRDILAVAFSPQAKTT
ncbi:histone-binding protein RBBP4 or subunit C of CAF1 complex-domain-containing protein [Lentinula raphanica]|nr:histone-binding protein RBBP4 or subunit C of CAF1 complex-domain-containing protein [Lentinula raphanica]